MLWITLRASMGFIPKVATFVVRFPYRSVPLFRPKRKRPCMGRALRVNALAVSDHDGVSIVLPHRGLVTKSHAAIGVLKKPLGHSRRTPVIGLSVLKNPVMLCEVLDVANDVLLAVPASLVAKAGILRRSRFDLIGQFLAASDA
jgi:hypothetical protein